MNIKNDQKGFLAPVALLAVIGVAIWGGFAYKQSRHVENGGPAAVILGQYGAQQINTQKPVINTKPVVTKPTATNEIGVANVPVNKITNPSLRASSDTLKKTINCAVSNRGAASNIGAQGTSQGGINVVVDPRTTIDPKRHPLLNTMYNTNAGGYCAPYSILLSRYYTYGETEIQTGLFSKNIPIMIGGKLNMDAVEYLVKQSGVQSRSGSAGGLNIQEIANAYVGSSGSGKGTKCAAEDFHDNEKDAKKICEELTSLKTQKVDCDMILSGFDGGHAVNIKTAKWDAKKKACILTVWDTATQGQSASGKPATHTVTLEVGKQGNGVTDVGYPSLSEFAFDSAQFMCCK